MKKIITDYPIKGMWMTFEEYRKLKKFTDNIDKKFKSFLRYGIHKGEHTELKKLEGGNKQGSISLKDSSKVVAGTGYTTLLRIEEGRSAIQNKAVHLPSKRVTLSCGYIYDEKDIRCGEPKWD